MAAPLIEAVASDMTYTEWAEMRRDLVETLDASHETDPETFSEAADALRKLVDDHRHHHNSYIGSLAANNLRSTTPSN